MHEEFLALQCTQQSSLQVVCDSADGLVYVNVCRVKGL